MNDTRRHRLTLTATLILAAALFAMDAITPLGVAGGLPYLVVVLVGLLGRMPRTILLLAALCTVLIGIGYYLSAPGSGPPSVAMLNRVLAIGAIWSTAIVSYVHLRSLATLKPLADRDELTGLYNRHYFNTEARRQFGAWRRYGNPLSLIMLDIDHFKRINDRHGHPAGDEVLKALAATLLAQTRELDTTCRYGGEEFVMLLPFTDLSGALAKAHQIKNAIDALSVPWRHERLRFHVSMGVAELHDSQWEPADLVAAADRALYRAKAEGRNRICAAGGPQAP